MDTQIKSLPVVACLYKLIVGEQWYIGSSYDGLINRMDTHYRQALLTPDRKLYKAVAENGGWSTVLCEVLVTFPFTSKEDLWRQEDAHINLSDPLCLNTNRAILTEDERATQKQEVSARCKRELYAKRRQDPEWVAKEKERARALYQKQKEDPEFMARKRAQALASYHRRKGGNSSPKKSLCEET